MSQPKKLPVKHIALDGQVISGRYDGKRNLYAKGKELQHWHDDRTSPRGITVFCVEGLILHDNREDAVEEAQYQKNITRASNHHRSKMNIRHSMKCQIILYELLAKNGKASYDIAEFSQEVFERLGMDLYFCGIPSNCRYNAHGYNHILEVGVEYLPQIRDELLVGATKAEFSF